MCCFVIGLLFAWCFVGCVVVFGGFGLFDLSGLVFWWLLWWVGLVVWLLLL